MIVFRDTSGANHHRVPAWAHGWASGEIMGRTYFCHDLFRDALRHRDDVEWVDVGDGYEAAIYETPDMRLYVRTDENIVQCGEMEDVTGIRWAIPLILDDDGMELVRMRRKMVVVDGEAKWQAVAGSERVQNAIDCAKEIRLRAEQGDTWGESDLCNAALAVVCLVLILPPVAVGALGLIGDGVIGDGMCAACGVSDHDEAS